MSNIKDLAQQIDSLTVKEVRELVDALMELGYELPTTVVTTVQPVTEVKIEEKKTFNVILTSINDKKLSIIKVYNKIIDGKLIETKALIESPLPFTLKKDVSIEEAESLKKELEEAGATIIIQ
jgi:large subunit ribosomal protein L7/L12